MEYITTLVLISFIPYTIIALIFFIDAIYINKLSETIHMNLALLLSGVSIIYMTTLISLIK